MSDRRFEAFVLFAEMRTGSNYLEASLNELPDVDCLGEIYNPTFMGHHNTFEMFGYDMDRREADPLGLVDAMIAGTDGLPGFRLFHDHDDRVVDRVLSDPKFAKIILTRNPLDSYVSRKIATATGQWRLTDMKHQRSAQIRFDAEEFAELLERLQAFQLRLQKGLQSTGQTAFYLRYEDINDPEVLNGIATYLGSAHQVKSASKKLKKQNPSDLSEKVENYDEMVAALARFDRFDLGQTPNFEPPRHAGVPGFVAHPDAGLLFIPVKGAPEAAVLDWMGSIGGVGRDALLRRMTQKELRQWMKGHPGFRSFSVLRHPVERAYAVFNTFILPDDRPAYAEPRQVMRQRYAIPIPATGLPDTYDADSQKAAFQSFLLFLKGNLAAQTSIRVDQAWATQSAILQAASAVTLPHRIVPEAQMCDLLPDLAVEAGVKAPPVPDPEPVTGPFLLKDVYDGKTEQATIDAYRRDYLNFGFLRWNKQ